MKINIENEKEKAIIFSERKTTVHIKKLNGFFHNGLILEVGEDFFVLKDRFDGREVFVLFKELEKEISIFKEAGE